MSVAVVFKPGGESSSKSVALPTLPRDTLACNDRPRQSHSRPGFRRPDRHEDTLRFAERSGVCAMIERVPLAKVKEAFVHMMIGGKA